jgi:hypothetical protein
MNSCVALGRGTINSSRVILVKGGGEWGPEWAGPTGLGPFWFGSAPVSFPLLLMYSRTFPFYPWALGVIFLF